MGVTIQSDNYAIDLGYGGFFISAGITQRLLTAEILLLLMNLSGNL